MFLLLENRTNLFPLFPRRVYTSGVVRTRV